MNRFSHAAGSLAVVLALGLSVGARAQDQAPAAPKAPAAATKATPTEGFDAARSAFEKRLIDANAELAALEKAIADEKVPLMRALADAETGLKDATAKFQEATAKADRGDVDTGKIVKRIKALESQNQFLSDLLSQFTNDFETRIHIAELKRYRDAIESAKYAPEQKDLPAFDRFGRQVGLIETALDRLEGALGGTKFEGTAINEKGQVVPGTFVLLGPAAFFRSQDGEQVGTAEQRLGSLEPRLLPYTRPEARTQAAAAIADGTGMLPIDATLGDAHKVAATEETIIDEFHKGGMVMWPILILAGIALLMALYKFVELMLVRRPSARRFNALLTAVDERDVESAEGVAHSIRGPTGRMLVSGVEHINEPRELLEEVMYEKVLKTRLRLQRLLPFIAICAAASPLLGLLGTVTGIIETFKMITLFGSGDVKSLSGGISKALLTTKWGLCVAIPSLLLHAFLSRKARGLVGAMESSAVQFANRVTKAGFGRQRVASEAPIVMPTGDRPAAAQPDNDLVRARVNEILTEMLEPINAGFDPNGKLPQES